MIEFDGAQSADEKIKKIDEYLQGNVKISKGKIEPKEVNTYIEDLYNIYLMSETYTSFRTFLECETDVKMNEILKMILKKSEDENLGFLLIYKDIMKKQYPAIFNISELKYNHGYILQKILISVPDLQYTVNEYIAMIYFVPEEFIFKATDNLLHIVEACLTIDMGQLTIGSI